MGIGEIQTIRLCTLPTPLTEAPRLSARLGGPQIFIKRDDLTGLAMGGNKARALEFLMTEVKDVGTDIVLAVGPEQSNWLCNVTAAARKLGMDVILFIINGNHKTQGNLLLDRILGAEIRFMEVHGLSTVYEQMDNLAAELRSQGHRPYVFYYGGAIGPLGIAGYVSLVSEICRQLQEKGLTAQYLFLASGSGCTQAGLILGARYFKAPFKIVGINPSGRSSRAEKICKIADLANETAKFLRIDCSFTPDKIIVHDGYIGSGPLPTNESIQAIKLLAETEGVFLDPIYSGKAMAALIDQVRDGKIKREDTVIFYHSGGLPAIFAYNEELLS